MRRILSLLNGPLAAILPAAAVLVFLVCTLFAFEEQDLRDQACGGDESCAFDEPSEFFKYGSLGGEATTGIPYKVFAILPDAFPGLMPGQGGYRAFGLPWEEGRILPVGFSLSTLGFERVTQTCALCHAASYRLTPDDKPRIALAGPGHTTNLGELLDFLDRAARHEDFTASHLLPFMEQRFDLGFVEAQLYRFLIIPALRTALREQADSLAWRYHLADTPAGDQPETPGADASTDQPAPDHRNKRPLWGPGRDATVNLARFALLGQPDDGAVDTTDFPAIWNLSPREGELLQWAGETSDLMTFIRDSAFGLGARPGPGFEQRMQKLRFYLIRVQPPPLPAELRPDTPTAARGRAVFLTHCADCHDPSGKRTGTVIEIDEIGTDPARFDTWTVTDDALANDYLARAGLTRVPMAKQTGYVAPRLTGLWLRGPYLHNGSVPTVRDLLLPVDERPKVFMRGCDIVDADNLGFLSNPNDPTLMTHCPLARPIDTTQRGNGNGGHTWGAIDHPGKPALTDAQVNDLLAYLKTL
jgi:mono/diheme cytochrome c family protein